MTHLTEQMREALEKTICHACGNPIGWNGVHDEANKRLWRSDWRECSFCKRARAALSLPERETQVAEWRENIQFESGRLAGLAQGKAICDKFHGQSVQPAPGAGEGLIAPIKDLIAYHEKHAKEHVSSQWIYGEHMMAVGAYKKVLEMIAALASQDGETPRDDKGAGETPVKRSPISLTSGDSAPGIGSTEPGPSIPAAAPSETALRIIERMEMAADIGVMVGSTVVKDFAKELRAALREAKDLQQR